MRPDGKGVVGTSRPISEDRAFVSDEEGQGGVLVIYVHISKYFITSNF